MAIVKMAAAVLAIATPGLVSAVDSLCRQDEHVYFSCDVGENLVSLCASPDLSPDAGYLQYRFGRSGQIKMQHPSKPKHPKENFKAYSESGAKGGTEALGFQIGAYSYGVFVTRSAFGYNGAGVMVGKAGTRLRHFSCMPKSIVSDPFYSGEARASQLGLTTGDVDYLGTEASPEPSR